MRTEPKQPNYLCLFSSFHKLTVWYCVMRAERTVNVVEMVLCALVNVACSEVLQTETVCLMIKVETEVILAALLL